MHTYIFAHILTYALTYVLTYVFNYKLICILKYLKLQKAQSKAYGFSHWDEGLYHALKTIPSYI